MPRSFEELDYRETPLGALSLRRRVEPRAGSQVVYEVKLDEAFLMSSLFTEGERGLATLGLRWLDRAGADVLVGGLGLGYTAAAALDEPTVGSLLVVDALGEVIEWHRSQLLPLGEQLCGDSRCRLICGDFFALAQSPEEGFDHTRPGRRFDAILLDVDHSPEHWLAPGREGFYGVRGLATLAEHLTPGGVFAMWSNDPPEPAFVDRLRGAFAEVRAETIRFPNPYQGTLASCTVYQARRSE